MRVLLDESVHVAFARDLTYGEVRTVRSLGWMGVGNGELLQRAVAHGFDALVTADRNFEYQQNIALSGLGVIILIAPSNRIDDLRPLASQVDEALAGVQPGQVVHVGTEFWKVRKEET
jgi:hypothetical protein